MKLKDCIRYIFASLFLSLKTPDCLLPKLFSKICFMFHAWAFDDVMTFEYLKS